MKSPSSDSPQNGQDGDTNSENLKLPTRIIKRINITQLSKDSDKDKRGS